MIKPHGSDELNPLFVYDSAENDALQQEAEELASVLVSSATAANAVMLGAGYFNPLTGYMNKADALSVATDMKTSSGLFWPTPVLNLVSAVVTEVSYVTVTVDANHPLAGEDLVFDIELVEIQG